MAISMDSIQNLSPDLQRAFASALTAERKPLQALQQQKEKLEAKVGLLNDIVGKVDAVKGLLPGLNSPIAIRELTVKSNDEAALTGTADKNIAQPGTYNIEVMQLASGASAISNGFADRNETRIGTGYFAFTNSKGETQEIFIDDENATLDGVANIINQSRIGLKASVINDLTDPDYPWRIVLSSDGTGTESNVEFPEFYFIDGDDDFYMDREKPATNALVRFEGHDIELPANKAVDMIPGLTVDIKGLSAPGRPGQLTIEQDIPKTTVKVKDLVEKLNGVFSFIQQQNSLDEKTDTSKTLGGDYSMRVSEQRLRNALAQNFLGQPGRAIQSLHDLGIQFEKNGLLKMDEKKFEDTLNSHFDEVVDFLSGDGAANGIIPRLTNSLNSLTTGQGVLASQRTTEQTKIKRIEDDMKRKEKASDEKMEGLKMRLARAQSAISSIQKQAAGIAQGGGGGGVGALLG